MPNTILIFILMFFIYFPKSSSNCIPPPDCECKEGNKENDYTLSCPLFDIKRAKESNKIEVTCKTDTDISDRLPRFNETVDMLVICHCELNSDYLKRMMSKMKLNRVKHLMVNFGNFTNIEREMFEDFKDIQIFHLNKNNLSFVPEDLISNFKQLQTIAISNNQLRSLPEDFFGSSNNIEQIDLSGNFITEIPNNVFRNLTKVRVLHLMSNKIKHVSSETFGGMQKLRVLDLKNNLIRYFATDTFKYLPELRTLVLNSNEIELLPSELFKSNTLLVEIDLSQNKKLKTVPGSLFENLTHLTTVYLNDCALTSLSENVFAGATGITSLDISNNNIESLPQQIFRDMISLKRLNLKNNNLTTLPSELFRKLSRLKKLNLDDNKLQIIDDSLKGMFSIDRIQMKNNCIRYVGEKAFQDNKLLVSIDLSHNNLTGFVIPENLSELKTITLAHNNLSDYSIRFLKKIDKLEELDLSNNHYENLQSYLRQEYAYWTPTGHKTESIKMVGVFFELLLKELLITRTLVPFFCVKFDEFISVESPDVKINLSNNKIKHINTTKIIYTGLGIYKTTINFDLKENPVHCDCTIFNLTKHIASKHMFFSGSLLTINNAECSSPETLSGLKVNEVELSKLTCPSEGYPCPCKDCSYRPFDSTFIVNCSDQGLNQLPLIPDYDLSRMEVYLTGNDLRNVLKPASGFEKTVILDLADNNITDIKWLPSEIQTLKLHNNKITNFNSLETLLLDRKTLNNITLHNNPWECDCKIVEFTKNFLVNHTRTIYMRDNISCRNENNESIVFYKLHEICVSRSVEPRNAIIITISVAGALLGVLAALYFRYQQEVKVWLFSRNMCLWFVQEEELDRHKSFDAFISYSHKDEEFVVNELVPRLEGGSKPFKLCLHFRNWKPGEFIAANIARSINESRRTIVILSRNFIESEWGKMEFRTAHLRALAERRVRVIVILLGDIQPADELDPELAAYLNTNTYVRWGDPWFWSKLRYALPRPAASCDRTGSVSPISANIADSC